MEFREGENRIPENTGEPSVPQQEAESLPEMRQNETAAAFGETGSAGGGIPDIGSAQDIRRGTDAEEPPRNAVPVFAPPAASEPPWLRTHYAAETAPSGTQPAGPRYGETCPAPGRYAGSGTYRAKKKHTGRNVFLLILASLVSFALGGGSMFCAIYTGALADIEDFFRYPFHMWYDMPPSQGAIPDDKEEILPPDDDTEEEKPSDGDTSDDGADTAPEEGARKPFLPLDDAPLLNIITVEEEGENYRAELDIPSIAELAKPSVVGVIKYVSEDPLEGYTIGSGIIFTEDGYIITNEHVISEPYSITVLLNDGTEYEAMVVASDDDADIAILKINAHSLIPAEFGDSTQLRVGEISVAIGCPASVDLQGTTTSGIISALDRVITVDPSGRTMRLLQTDAAINPGNSGGPLLNKYGQVIGINTVKLSSTTYEGLCFAIPTSELESIVADLFTYGYVRGYPAIGITASSVLAEEDEYGGAPAGVLVATVDPLSGAYGKIEVGDIITHCNGTSVVAVAQINTIKNRLKVGDSITLTVYRRGETFDAEILLVDQYDLTGN